MKEILQFTILNKFKSVYRMNSVVNRKESAAEHTWSALMLADFLFDKVSQKIDKLHVYELLMYHDIVEIEAGDTPFKPGFSREKKQEKELAALSVLKKKLPSKMTKKLGLLFTEYEEQQTIEAKYAKIIDILDAQIHELDYKEDWKGWTEEFIRKKEFYFEDFPELRKIFEQMIKYLVENKYLE